MFSSCRDAGGCQAQPFVYRVWVLVVRILSCLVGIGLVFSSTSFAIANCAPDALGTARTIVLDPNKHRSLNGKEASLGLRHKEVILTFDDGPQAKLTDRVLAALKRHCTKATFFSIGKMALGLPEIIRRVHKAGHTVASHTWSHKNLGSKKNKAIAIEEIEKGISAVKRAVGKPIAPFFRYPFLRDSKESLGHLAKRNLAIFSMDVDTFDFKYRDPRKLAQKAVEKMKAAGKGILLMHDIQPVTAKAILPILDGLQAAGFKVVHMTAAFPVTSLPKYDKAIEKNVRGLGTPGSSRPTSSVVKTITQ